MRGEEIVALLYFNDDDAATGLPADDEGVVDWDAEPGDRRMFRLDCACAHGLAAGSD